MLTDNQSDNSMTILRTKKPEIVEAPDTEFVPFKKS